MRSAARVMMAGLALAIAGCPPVKEDGLEPNDTPEQATVLAPDVAVTARTVQGNVDVFAIGVEVTGGTTINELRFTFETIGGDVCPAFHVTAPDGSTLYRDTNAFCGRAFDEPEKVPAATLEAGPDDSYTLTVPAEISGRYILTVNEKGRADNVFDFFWDYRLTASIVGAAP